MSFLFLVPLLLLPLSSSHSLSHTMHYVRPPTGRNPYCIDKNYGTYVRHCFSITNTHTHTYNTATSQMYHSHTLIYRMSHSSMLSWCAHHLGPHVWNISARERKGHLWSCPPSRHVGPLLGTGKGSTCDGFIASLILPPSSQSWLSSPVLPLQVHHYVYLWKRVWSEEGLGHKLSILLKGPGWTPRKPRLGCPGDIPEVRVCGREGWRVYMYYYYVMLLHMYKNNIRPTTHNIHTATRSHECCVLHTTVIHLNKLPSFSRGISNTLPSYLHCH